ncbi:MAG: D-cysteine desulfhydrase family protein [Dehalococcoidales bacterium]
MIPSIAKLPRISLGNYPTPLMEAYHLSAVLGGPRIIIKRDDLTGLAFGGNKCRKLEYVLADAQQRGIDTLITSGSSQSNHALQTAAAGRKLGMQTFLVLVKGIHVEIQGNLLLQNILNSAVKILDVADPSEMFTTLLKKMNELADELRSKGRNPLVIPAGAEVPLGTVGWVNAAEEISQQLRDQKIDVQYVVLPHGGGGTQAGLVLGFKQLKLPLNVVGISVMHKKGKAIDEVVTLVNETAKLLALDVAITPDEVTVYDDYVGQGYGIITDDCIEAIRLVAQTEGIFLDPVYTGKAMAGLIDLIRKDQFSSKDTVVFIHTGGLPGVFAYHQELAIPMELSRNFS